MKLRLFLVGGSVWKSSEDAIGGARLQKPSETILSQYTQIDLNQTSETPISIACHCFKLN